MAYAANFGRIVLSRHCVVQPARHGEHGVSQGIVRRDGDRLARLLDAHGHVGDVQQTMCGNGPHHGFPGGEVARLPQRTLHLEAIDLRVEMGGDFQH
jgi:hypothetical protein